MNKSSEKFVQNDEKIFPKPIDIFLIMMYNIGTVKDKRGNENE